MNTCATHIHAKQIPPEVSCRFQNRIHIGVEQSIFRTFRCRTSPPLSRWTMSPRNLGLAKGVVTQNRTNGGKYVALLTVAGVALHCAFYSNCIR